MPIVKRGLILVLLVAISSPSFGQATYNLEFVSDWSAETHPTAYPTAAHFSPLIGGTHNGAVSYWELGAIASPAIEQMAELGGTSQLRNLVQGDIDNGNAREIMQIGGILFAPGKWSGSFTVSAQHPQLTLVTMVAPSPDWFVGVSGLDFRANGQWVDSLVLDLDTYDAGTDAGSDFTSPNMDITPHLPISILGSPLAGLPPLARLEFTLASSTPLCDLNSDGSCNIADLDELLGIAPIAAGLTVEYGTNDHFDLNGDGVIDLADRNDWLLGAAVENGFASAYLPADANLDGFVDGQDFIAWNNHKFTTSLAASEGDFNADGVIDGQDFIVWNDHKFTSLERLFVVPEPAWGAFLVTLLIGMVVRLRSNLP